MKHCLHQNQWGKEKRCFFISPPEESGEQRSQTPEEVRDRELAAIQEETHRNLELGVADVENGMDIEKSIDSLDQRRIQDSFDWHITSLNKQYFKPIKLKKFQRERYLKWAKKFEEAIKERTHERLQKVWEISYQKTREFSTNSELEAELRNVKAELRNIKIRLEESYKRFSGTDGYIEPAEVENIFKARIFNERIRKQNLEENINMLQQEKDPKKVKLILESMYFFKPEVWRKTVPLLADNLYSLAEKDANEPAIIALANQLDRGTISGRITDFDSAKEFLTQEMKRRGELGVQETLALVRVIENALQPKWVRTVKKGGKPRQNIVGERIEKYSKASFIGRLNYLKGKPKPPTAEERMIIEFINSSRQDRANLLRGGQKGELLADRELLFRGIHIAETNRKTEYEGYFRTERAKKNEDRRLKHGYLGGIVMLGEEAKSIVENFDSDLEFTDLDLTREMTRIGSQVKGEIPRYKRNKKKKFNRGVISPLEAQGINARDLTLGGVKVVAMATLVINSLNTINSADGNNIIAKIGNGLKDIATLKNPTVALSLGVIFGARTLQKNKYLFDYWKVDGFEQKSMLVNLKLHRMADKVNYHAIKRYIHNDIEWQMMAEIEEKGNSETIKQILDNAKKRRREKKSGVNLVLKEDFKTLWKQGIISNTTYKNMTDSAMSGHVRFEFLKRFRQGKKPLNVSILRQMCTGKKI